ncbi:pyridoxamine 5'-phosphate oxidase family protein [Kordiimonas pumila]|uniref:Pyridoxamine 5'-phosphate oxidase family protein n=1 Tax=Kordiimonas pumila TaxID=2161677 RepID=A0ABV7CZW4_9PROT|nr:pyridoxamine 5'-phosphate oxidase family protein [Kordiimonas pumila]
MDQQKTSAFKRNDRNRIKRGHKRGHYDQKTVYDIIDSHFLCHVAYEVDGQPFIVPTSHWREGNKLYWHGSIKSQMIRHLAKGNSATVSVTHIDGLVLARSAFSTSVNYRSAICYGTPTLVTDKDEWVRVMKLFFDKLAPERWEQLRPMTDQEYKATGLLEMDIEDAAAKVRADPPGDGEEADWPIWAGVIPLDIVERAPIKAPEKGGAPLLHGIMPAYDWKKS